MLYAQSVIASDMMVPVEIHELLGMGIRAVRLSKGWRQQDASNEFRAAGLRTWTPLAVGQVESGARKPSVGDLLLACVALGVSFADLVPETDEEIDLGAGTVMSARAAKAILSGVSADSLPVDLITTPGDRWLAEAYMKAVELRRELEPKLKPIWDGAGRTIRHGDVRRSYLPPTEAEQRAADRLGILPEQLKAAARVLYSRDFEEERDARVQDGDAPAQSIQARRGHATRALLAEIGSYLIKCGLLPNGEGEQSDG